MMKATTSLHRPALAGIAAVGLTATVLLAPAAHADTELDLAEESASTAVAADAEAASGAAGGEAAVEGSGDAVAGTVEELATDADDQTTSGTGEEGTGDEGTGEAGEEVAGDAEAANTEAEPAEAGVADETADQGADAGEPEQDALCLDGAAGEEQPAEAGSAEAGIAETGGAEAGTAETEVAEAGTAEEGSDVAAGLPEAGPAGEGTVTDPECADPAPEQAGENPDDTQLPVGGVDAGGGEAAGQNMVLPVAAAGAAAAAIGLGAYTLVRRRRSDA